MKLTRFSSYCVTAEVIIRHVSRELKNILLLSDSFTVHSYDHQSNKTGSPVYGK